MKRITGGMRRILGGHVFSRAMAGRPLTTAQQCIPPACHLRSTWSGADYLMVCTVSSWGLRMGHLIKEALQQECETGRG
jgi:hypothetical protein